MLVPNPFERTSSRDSAPKEVRVAVRRSWPAGNAGQCGLATVAFLATLAYCFLQLAGPKNIPLRTNHPLRHPFSNSLGSRNRHVLRPVKKPVARRLDSDMIA